MNKEHVGFTPHLMVDCYGCPPDKLADREFVLGALHKIPEALGNKRVKNAYAFDCAQEKDCCPGVSGVALSENAHVSVHTFPDKQHAFIDIFFNHEFDTQQACQQLVHFFGADRHEVKVLCRGNNFENEPRVYH